MRGSDRIPWVADQYDGFVRQKSGDGLLVGSRRLVGRWRESDIGEGFKLRIGAPFREVGKRKVNHHRAGRVLESSHLGVEFLRQATCKPNQRRRGNTRDHRLSGMDNASIGEFNARHLAGYVQNAGYLSIGIQS